MTPDERRQFVEHYCARLTADDDRARLVRSVVARAPAMTVQQAEFFRGLFPPPSDELLRQVAGSS